MRKTVVCMLAAWAVWQAGASEAGWLTDFPKAQAQAKAEHKMVLLDFNGSDWCPPCKALHKNVLSTPEFMGYAKKHLVLMDVDFPAHKKQSEALKKANKALAEKFNIEGYPTIVVLSSNGKQLKKSIGYEGEGPKEFIASLQKLKDQ